MIKGCESCERLQDEVRTLKEQAEVLKQEVADLVLAKKAYQTVNFSLEDKLATKELRPLDLKKPRKHQAVNATACCPLCKTFLFKAAGTPGMVSRKSRKDELACPGRKWWAFWSNCPKTHHLHRHCYWCDARWMEAP